ncbi:MAG: hypothetical protein NPINA01_13150 [Nitrospinaceae bacterium]|nr:MAG: hypothetical protein NPINA01_13150 [Nitrospinaceae bacterium]
MENNGTLKAVRFISLPLVSGWKPLIAALVILHGFGCASSKGPADFPEETHSERSFLKKTADFVTPRKKSPSLLPYQKDLRQARYQYNLQNYDLAEFYLKKTLLQVGDEPSALKLLAWTYFFQKRYDKALLAFERNHTIHPREPSFLIGMGWCYLSLNNHQQALKTFSKAEKFSDRIYDLHKGKAIIHLKQKNPEKALPSLKKIYSPYEVESILTFWQSHEDLKADAALPVLPTQSGDPSLFTLPVEHPRYRSILWPLNRHEDEALEKAWRYFRKKLYRRSLKAFQDLPEPLFHSLDAQNGMAWSYLKLKKIVKAEQVFKSLSRRHPNFIGIVKGMQESKNIKMKKGAFAEYYLDLGKARIAEKKFEDLVDEYPDWAYPYTQLGMLELKNGNLEEANEYFQESLELEPGNQEGLKGLEELEKIKAPKLYAANQARKAGDHKEAASLYFHYIEGQQIQERLTEPQASAYSGLGWSQYEKGQYALAIEKFKQARRHKKYQADAIKGLGFSYSRLKKYREAAYYLEIAHRIFPEEEQVSHRLDWVILKSWRTPKAQRYFEKELQTNPLRPSLYMGLGWVNFQQDKPDLAVEYFLKSISLDPDSAVSEEFSEFLRSQRFGWQVYNRLGWAYYHQKDFEKSSEMFKVSIRERPDQSEANKGMGYNLYQTKQYETAIEYLKKALAINQKPNPVVETVSDDMGPFKKQTTVRSKLAKAYFHTGDHAQAIRYYQKALAHTPGLPDAYDGLGWVYLQLHRLTESRAAFTQAIRLDPLNRLSHKGLREVKQSLATQNIRIKQSDFSENSMSHPPA